MLEKNTNCRGLSAWIIITDNSVVGDNPGMTGYGGLDENFIRKQV